MTRLPATYSECARAIAEAVDGETWTHLGCLAENASAKNRPCAVYRIMEKSVVLYGKKYRAVLVHLNSQDKRRQKKLEKNIRKSHGDILKETSANPCRFFCRADADAAATRAGKLSGKLHKVTVTVSAEKLPTRGSPPKDTPRKTRQEYVLAFNVDGAMKCYNQVRNIYSAAGVPERLEGDLFTGEHAWGGNKSKTFFGKHLKR